MFQLDLGMTEGWVDALNLIDQEMPYRKDDFYKAIKADAQAQHVWWFNVIKQLNLKIDRVNVYASGYGLYNVPLLRQLGATSVTLYDYDAEVVDINWRLNKYDAEHINFQQHVLDVIFDGEWIDKNVDFVLNTSCEVMYNFAKTKKMYGEDTLFCLQGTNYPKKGNINLAKSIDAFIFSTGLTNILYQGVMPDNEYERYMVIGK